MITTSSQVSLDISELVVLYKQAKARFDQDGDFKEAARKEVVKLQAGDDGSLAAWRALVDQSERAFNEVYSTLNIDERLETRGESCYNRNPKP